MRNMREFENEKVQPFPIKTLKKEKWGVEIFQEVMAKEIFRTI